jgi:hypothetical protein
MVIVGRRGCVQIELKGFLKASGAFLNTLLSQSTGGVTNIKRREVWIEHIAYNS